MCEEVKTFDPEAHRKAWLGRLLAEFVKLEGLFPVQSSVPEEDTPKWVQNVEREIAATMLPIARLKDESNLSPKRMGGLIGHSCAYAVWMMGDLEGRLKRASEQQPSEAEQDILSTLTPEQIALVEKYLLDFLKFYEALRRLAKRSLCSSVDQTYEDMTEFLLGYSEAFSQKPKTQNASDMGNTATQVYLYMFIWRQVVNSMQSAHQLHQWLVGAFGSYRVGDLKRTEKMCQRIGLSYRKPGRPKKSK